MVGGYWIIKAESKEQAVEWARRIPADEGDIVEVRQIQEMSDFTQDVVDAVKDNAPNLVKELAPDA